MTGRVGYDPRFNFNVADYGAQGDGVTDDSAAINACIAAAFAYAQTNGGARVVFPAGVFLCNGAFQDPSGANAILNIPTYQRGAVGSETRSITLEFAGPYSPSLHYNDGTEWLAPPPLGGAIIYSTKTGTGTTPALMGCQNGAYPAMNWMHARFTDLTFRTSVGSGLIGLNLYGMGAASIERCAFDRDVTASLGPGSNTADTGFTLPIGGNQAALLVSDVTVCGQYVGCIVGEHTDINRIWFQNCNYGLQLAGAAHPVRVGTLLAQLTTWPIYLPSGNAVLYVANASIEQGNLVLDSNNGIQGEVHYKSASGGTLTNSGASGVRMYRLDVPIGVQTAPSIPATTVALTNPFDRDCAVTITGGTVTAISIGSTATGLTSGTVIVPSRASIKLTYSAAPSWVWVAL